MKETDTERLKEMKQTDRHRLLSYRVQRSDYLLETREALRDDRHRETQRDETDRQSALSYRVQGSGCNCWRQGRLKEMKQTDRQTDRQRSLSYRVQGSDCTYWRQERLEEMKQTDRQTEIIILQGARVWLYLLETERLKEMKQTDRQTEIIIIQGARVWLWLYLLETRETQRWNRQTEIIILQGAKVWLYLLEQGRKNNDVTPATWPSPSVKYFFRASFSACLSSCTFVNSCQFHLSANKIRTVVRVGIAQWLERRTPD